MQMLFCCLAVLVPYLAAQKPDAVPAAPAQVDDETTTRGNRHLLSLVDNYDIDYAVFRINAPTSAPIRREKLGEFVSKAALAWNASPDVDTIRSLSEGLGLKPEELHLLWSEGRLMQSGKVRKYVQRVPVPDKKEWAESVYTDEDGVATVRQQTKGGKTVVGLNPGSPQFHMLKPTDMMFEYGSFVIKPFVTGTEGGLVLAVFNPGDSPKARARVWIDPRLAFQPVRCEFEADEHGGVQYESLHQKSHNAYKLAPDKELLFPTFSCRYTYTGDVLSGLTLYLVRSARFNDSITRNDVIPPIPAGSLVAIADFQSPKPSATQTTTAGDAATVLTQLQALDQLKPAVEQPPRRSAWASWRRFGLALALVFPLVLIGRRPILNFAARRRAGQPAPAPSVAPTSEPTAAQPK